MTHGWVAATALRNHTLGNPLLDWLHHHGPTRGYHQDPTDPRTCFRTFLMEKGQRFERAVVAHLRTMVGNMRVLDGEPAAATVDVLRQAPPVVWQASLEHEPSRTYGTADLLIRSDILHRLFPQALNEREAAIPCGLGIGDRHYVVVDIKYSTLYLRADGTVNSSGSARAYKAQLYVYNRALAAVQGHAPAKAFLLGRGWTQHHKGQKLRVGDCMDRLGIVPQAEAGLGQAVDEAAEWIRQVRGEGGDWQVLPPSRDELRPNAKADQGQWVRAVGSIVEQGRDLTRLWQVGVAKRREANRRGVFEWTDPRVTARLLGIKGRRGRTLNAILDINRPGGAPVRPPHVNAARAEWKPEPGLEFYVDFETVSDVDDNLRNIPLRGGQPMIFMIGCGHVENGQWKFSCWTADRLETACEARIIDRWFDHMNTTTRRLAPGTNPRVLHWSSAESSQLETSYSSAVSRHPDRAALWPSPNWFDVLTRVIKAEPVVVRGAHGFGLKAVTGALSRLGLVDVSWDEGPADGLGAMVGAWWCQQQIEDGRVERLSDVGLMRQIRAYNETDCEAIMRIVAYLRERH